MSAVHFLIFSIFHVSACNVCVGLTLCVQHSKSKSHTRILFLFTFEVTENKAYLGLSMILLELHEKFC